MKIKKSSDGGGILGNVLAFIAASRGLGALHEFADSFSFNKPTPAKLHPWQHAGFEPPVNSPGACDLPQLLNSFNGNHFHLVSLLHGRGKTAHSQ
jgi:hypothetical protein